MKVAWQFTAGEVCKECDPSHRDGMIWSVTVFLDFEQCLSPG
jgi:hypothetical protein